MLLDKSHKNLKIENLSVKNKIAQISLKRRRSLKLLEKSKQILQAKKQYVGDRFMGHRGAMNFDKLTYTFFGSSELNNIDIYDKTMSISNLVDKVMLPKKTRFIKHNVNQKTPTSTERLHKFLKMRAIKPSPNRQPTAFKSAEVPEKLFDSNKEYISNPEFICTDWAKNGYLAIGFENTVIVWDEVSAASFILCECEKENNKYFTSLKWLESQNFSLKQRLAVSNTSGVVEIWELDQIVSRVHKGQTYVFCDTNIVGVIDTKINNIEKRILALTFNGNILSVGSVTGSITHHNMLNNSSLVSYNHFHKMEINLMKWSTDFKYLAITANDNIISVWSCNDLSNNPVSFFKENCPVYCLAWHPEKCHNVLMFPSGVECNYIKVVDVLTKVCIVSVNCDSQIAALHWSALKKQIIIACRGDQSTTYQLRDEVFLDKIKTVQYYDQIQKIVSSPSGERLAAISDKGVVQIWKFYTKDKPKNISYMRC